MPEKIPFPPQPVVICTLRTCRWVGPLSEATVIRGHVFCPLCSCACERDEPCDEPIILHSSGGSVDPLAVTK